MDDWRDFSDAPGPGDHVGRGWVRRSNDGGLRPDWLAQRDDDLMRADPELFPPEEARTTDPDPSEDAERPPPQPPGPPRLWLVPREPTGIDDDLDVPIRAEAYDPNLAIAAITKLARAGRPSALRIVRFWLASQKEGR